MRLGETEKGVFERFLSDAERSGLFIDRCGCLSVRPLSIKPMSPSSLHCGQEGVPDGETRRARAPGGIRPRSSGQQLR